MNQQTKDQLKTQFGLQDEDLSDSDDKESVITKISQKTGQSEDQVRSGVESAWSQSE